MEIVQDIVIVGAGIAGLTTALGLHRLGLRSLVLESSDSLRTAGFAFATWTNAWKALDAIGIGDTLRQQHDQLHGLVAASSVSGLPTSQMSFTSKGIHGNHEVRCVRRKMLIEVLEKELPRGTIRYSSKVVSIEESGHSKLVHLADGSILKTKVLIGCDGVNSIVAKWLGLQKPAFTGRSTIRGYSEFPDGHGFEPKFLQFFGDGFRNGFLPINSNSIYWFFTWDPSTHYEEDIADTSAKLKQLVLSKLGKVPEKVRGVVENTELGSIFSTSLRIRWPWDVLKGHIYKGNVCVTGDALHPMPPDIGQGACSALEDGVVLARCLAEAFSSKPGGEAKENIEEEYNRIQKGLEKFAKERKWRSFELISTAFMVGWIQHSAGKVMNFLRDKWFSTFLAGLLLKRADFDCGKLSMF
ncbi:hypothetical protein HHK36_002912 [Tetracentron sinense]|uniref:FAD-binding domain-containing protein n=1 Tax=Tetracentron sinense TaxID=13715 RepID=A0A834ZMB4_TETSI|nr:hypothetical protein HHK36_002912 [Tetracentron sinense]